MINPRHGGPVDYTHSGSYPFTCLACFTLPEAYFPESIGLGVIRAHKTPHLQHALQHVVVLGEDSPQLPSVSLISTLILPSHLCLILLSQLSFTSRFSYQNSVCISQLFQLCNFYGNI
jgi:hypothetical protein